MIKEWPSYFGERLHIKDPKNSVGVVCLWTPQKTMLRKLGDIEFCCLGNLYSVEGINYLIRNLYANPHIKYLVVAGEDLTGAGKVLDDMFNHGIYSYAPFLDANIDESHIAAIIDHVDVYVAKDLDHAKVLVGECLLMGYDDKRIGPWCVARTFPETKPEVNVFPSHEVAEVVRADSFMTAWTRIIHRIMTFGQLSTTQYGTTQREVQNLVTVLSPETVMNVGPEQFGISQKDFDYYLDVLLDPESKGAGYSYGSRLRGEFDQIIAMRDTLLKAKDSRRAAASTWIPDKDYETSNPPCLMTIHALVRDGKLNLTAFLRSNDIYRAWPRNAFALRFLQSWLVSELADCRIGTLTTISSSAHIYEDNYEAANKLVKDRHKAPGFATDPRGSFVITANEEIYVSHFSPSGSLLREFQGKRAADVKKQIMPYVTKVEHAFYLGRELERAQKALDAGMHYTNK